MSTISVNSSPLSSKRLIPLIVVLIAAWLAAYNLIQPLANWLTYTALGLESD